MLYKWSPFPLTKKIASGKITYSMEVSYLNNRGETIISNAFSIQSMVAMYFFPPSAKFSSDLGVSYDFWQLVYIDGGDYNCIVDGTPKVISHNQVLLCSPGAMRQTQNLTGNIGFVSFRCSPEKLSSISNEIINLSSSQQKMLSKIFSDGLDVFELIHEDGKIGQRSREGVSEFKLHRLKNQLELFLIDLCENHTFHNAESNNSADNQLNYFEQQLENIENFLKENLGNNITIDDVIAHSNLSLSTIKRLYRRFDLGGVMHHYTVLKIKEAKRLIRFSDMNMTEISRSLGFSSLHYFSRTFKKIAGASPREYAYRFVKK